MEMKKGAARRPLSLPARPRRIVPYILASACLAFCAASVFGYSLIRRR